MLPCGQQVAVQFQQTGTGALHHTTALPHTLIHVPSLGTNAPYSPPPPFKCAVVGKRALEAVWLGMRLASPFNRGFGNMGRQTGVERCQLNVDQGSATALWKQTRALWALPIPLARSLLLVSFAFGQRAE